MKQMNEIFWQKYESKYGIFDYTVQENGKILICSSNKEPLFCIEVDSYDKIDDKLSLIYKEWYQFLREVEKE